MLVLVAGDIVSQRFGASRGAQQGTVRATVRHLIVAGLSAAAIISTFAQDTDQFLRGLALPRSRGSHKVTKSHSRPGSAARHPDLHVKVADAHAHGMAGVATELLNRLVQGRWLL